MPILSNNNNEDGIVFTATSSLDPFITISGNIDQQTAIQSMNEKNIPTITQEEIDKIKNFIILQRMGNNVFAIGADGERGVLLSYIAIDFDRYIKNGIIDMSYRPMQDMNMPKVLIAKATENYKPIKGGKHEHFFLRTDNIPNKIIVRYEDREHNFSIVSSVRSIEKSDSGKVQLDKIIDAYALCVDEISDQARSHLRRFELNHRRVSIQSKKHQSKKIGLYVKHKVPFSCEIECYGKNRDTTALFVNEQIGKEIGVCHDGSLTSGLGYPIEMQTPILSGKRGEILIAELCQKLNNAHFKVDHTCGLHIHLDGSCFKLSDEEIRTGDKAPMGLLTTYLFYRLFDPVIMSFLPSTRRNNRYCAEMGSTTEYRGTEIRQDNVHKAFDIVRSMRSLLDFEMYWYKVADAYSLSNVKSSRYTPTRYYGVNFHSLLKDNHIEIRYHSGTMNYEKILYWVSLHGNIIEKCCNGEITIDQLVDIKNNVKGEEKLRAKMYELVGLNEEEIAYFELRYNTFKGVKDSVEILINKTKKSETA